MLSLSSILRGAFALAMIAGVCAPLLAVAS